MTDLGSNTYEIYLPNPTLLDPNLVASNRICHIRAMPYYYNVMPISSKYQDNQPLIYQSKTVKHNNELVLVQLKEQLVLGLVIKKVTKPTFFTKEMATLPKRYVWEEKSLDLAGWMSTYYNTPLSPALTSFIPQNLQQTIRAKISNDGSNDGSIKSSHSTYLPKLTVSQNKIIQSYFKHPPALLLHGDTGSGKTRVYIEMSRAVLDNNRSVLVLTPEISLVPQIFNQFYDQFKEKVIFMHSGLGQAQRREIWLRVLHSKGSYVLIGPRSAILAPHHKLGLIVIDEFHEAAYKQDQQPRYHAIRAASRLRQLHNAQLVLGSATPSIEEYYLFRSKQFPILTLPSIQKKQLGKYTVVDMRIKSNYSKNTLLSDKLIELASEALQQKQQVLLLLNRRGTSRIIMCNECGWELVCKNCTSNLVYHSDTHVARCHICGYRDKPPTSCSSCQNSDIFYKGVGTKALVDSVHTLFPTAKVMRFDTDNLANERFEKHYETILEGDVDIIIGTQIVAKGLDLPNLSVVGVLNAEAGLIFPDFTSEERTYQLLYQVLGRINRGHVPGNAVIQTLQPDSELIKDVVNGSWDAFYEKQLQHRKKYRFPPFSFLMKITASRSSAANAEKALYTLRDKMLEKKLAVSIDIPTPRFIEKIRGQYCWQLLVRSKNRKYLLSLAVDIPNNYAVDLDPSTAI